MQTFFDDSDYRHYKAILTESCKAYGVKVIAYCLMPNHVHLIVLPSRENSLSKAIGQAHECYSKYVNFKKGWAGYLWQGRYFSNPMDDEYFLRCISYVELNPVRANICAHPSDYIWSSYRGHTGLAEDPILSSEPLTASIKSWTDFIGASCFSVDEIRVHSRTGRPLGSESFLKRIEGITGRTLLKQKPGPKRSGSVARP